MNANSLHRVVYMSFGNVFNCLSVLCGFVRIESYSTIEFCTSGITGELCHANFAMQTSN
jgi:hypothetical protein